MWCRERKKWTVDNKGVDSPGGMDFKAEITGQSTPFSIQLNDHEKILHHTRPVGWPECCNRRLPPL